MIRDPLEHLARLDAGVSEFEARSAAGKAAAAAHGCDDSGVVTVSVDGDGRVTGVRLDSRWRQHLSVEQLGSAVVQAARAAAATRLQSWAEAFGADDVPAAPPAAVAADTGSIAEQLQRLTSDRRRTEEDITAALQQLLAMAQDIERGIDEVSARMVTVQQSQYTGHAADRRVEVTVTGAGDITGVQYQPRWLREAHEVNIGRHTVTAFEDAYEQAARYNTRRLIEDSALGEVQRVVQDPALLARKLGLSD